MTSLTDIDGDDASKYRLIGDRVLGYRFAVPHDAELYLGDVLKITDSVKGLTFFAKVNDLLHDCNFSDPKWDTRPHTEHFYGIGENVFILVEATPLGYVGEDGTFRKPRTLPAKFSRVERPESRDFAFLAQVMGEIEVGVMKTGQGVLKDVRVALHAQVMRQHMGVFATTGMGKSNFMKVFCASCMRAREFGLLIVDPHGEYVAGGRSSSGETTMGLLHYQAGRDGLEVFSTRPEEFRRKYHLNQLYLDYDDFRAPDLLLLYEHSPPQREVVEMLESTPGSEVIDFFQSTDFATFDAETYTGRHPRIANDLKNFSPSTLSVMQRRIAGMMNRNRGFFRRQGSSIPDVMKALHENKVVLIDIPGMSEQSELFVLSIITRKIMRSHQGEEAGGEEEPRQVLITIEEAQRVLGSGLGNTRTFREAAMEGRKFGVGLCVVTQQPKNIDARVLAQLNTFVVMGLSDRGDRDTIASSAKQDLSRLDTEIQTLERGEAVISTIGIPFPVSTRIHLFEEYIEELNRKPRAKPIDDGLENTF
ncbi:ATP-binding protein [Methanoculleus sp. FWC-SCC3]|uniref:ATP-binding protein n=1 Tax=Methanoculleus methanifontis TaxID=2584086 RepID=A0ABT8M4T9_9EURY|nr:ATP-binding protein [Methanoculleus sp. FWC-SCC3]MDN7013606.1 ATP-binding protein [Methanoculleus sp. FWC-SCC3]